MNLSAFDYNLPPELIATEPAQKRDQSRLLVLDKETGEIEHRHFFEIINYLEPGDLLIANNSKVIPARLNGKKSTGGEVEVFLSKNLGNQWECLIKGRVRVGTGIILSANLTAEIEIAVGDGVWLVRFNLADSDLMNELEKIGEVPLPPYILKARENGRTGTSPVPTININGAPINVGAPLVGAQGIAPYDDKTSYQTVYADDDKKGSVAAPTAGLHFTPELIEQIKAKGVAVEYLTLHVGLGTFLPVKTDKIEDHQIHSEWAEISAELVEKIIQTKQAGNKVIAVGTTTARTLEYFSDEISNLKSQFPNKSQISNDKLSSWVDIFIYPPYQFKIVDSLITNFHLPKSTLLMLVSALASKENIDQAYQEAIKEKYRFYSYGDAMVIK